MSNLLLAPTVYTPVSRGPGSSNTTEQNRTSRDYFSLGMKEGLRSPPARGPLSPAFSEDVPTPKASQYARDVMALEDYYDMYDTTDDETADVPLLASNSIKRTSSTRYPSVVIPSPSAWPTIEKLKETGRLPNFPLSPPIVSPSPKTLSKIANRNLNIPSSSSAPSLDGSLTSEELSSISCPSTPDLSNGRHTPDAFVEEWGVQLHPQALQTLRGLSSEEAAEVELASPKSNEMQETGVPKLKCKVDLVLTPVDNEEMEPISAISVPSPGGFFSSLDANVRNTWCATPDMGPNTGTAEAFYGVPWKESAASTPLPVERIVEVSDNLTDGPPTARALLTPKALPPKSEVPSVSEDSVKVADQDETYLQSLEDSAKANFDRTSLWLSAQETYISDLVDETSVTEVVVEAPSVVDAEIAGMKSPAKSVRWADEPSVSNMDKALPPSPKDEAFIEGFKQYRESNSRSDVFVQRKARVDALKLDRRCLGKAHRDQLQGKYEVASPTKPKASECFATEEATEQSQMLDRVQKDRQVLEQIKPVSWNLEATKTLNGGTLLTSPAGKTLFTAEEARVLDLGGQASCDWAWEVALQHPRSTVHTVYTADQAPQAKLEGPANHKHTVVPNLWTLPYPSNYFDIISARSLFALLKVNKASGRSEDEYDLCLKECFRCLKPGGYLEFALLDADVLGAGHKAQAVSVEFGFNLKTRGYDPAPTKCFLPRLKRAGFGQMRRAWLALPMARGSSGSTADASYISGMIGAWAWEKWMLKLQVEMGRNDERLLEGVAEAIEEGAETGAAWRYLSGWARKE